MPDTPRDYQTAAWLTSVGPYTLHPGPHLFTDWRFIDPGTPTYVDGDGQTIHYTDPLKGYHTQLRPVWFRGHNIPYGIRIAAERPSKSEPVEGPMGATVLYDGGRYRSWDGANYSESEDGVCWRRPALPGEEAEQDRNALFFDAVGVHGPGVFLDPSAPTAERYKMVFWSALGRRDRRELRARLYEAYVRRRPRDVDPLIRVRGGIDIVGGADFLFGATSPDGLHWRLVDEPFLLHMADNPNTMYYDALFKKYVLFTRVNWMYGRRAIGRSESESFGPFPQPEMLLWPELDRAPSDDLYTNAKCLYPGTVDQHFLFPTVYSHAADNGRIDMYSSPDSLHWFRVPRGPVLAGDYDTRDHGWLATTCGLVPLPDGRVGLPYHSSTFPHKYPRWPNRGDRGVRRYSVWQEGRLACVEATQEGFFATPPLKARGRQLRLNLKTPLSGEVRVEAVAITSWVGKRKAEEVIAGRSCDDCDPIRGDHPAHTVTWQGQADLGHAGDQPVYFRFKLRAAKLYAFEVI